MYDDFVKEINNLRCEKEQLNSLVNSCQEEIRQLKKQVEEYKEENCILDMKTDENIKLKKSTKKFIKYLADEIKIYENDIQNFSKDYKVYFSLINDLRVSKAKIEEILSKYKEIIEDDKQ